MNQKLINLYDAYKKRILDRREFLKKRTLLAGGTAAVSALLPLLESSYTRAQFAEKDDPRL